MDINQARNILGQINLAASEAKNGHRDPKDACDLILRLTDDMAKAMDFPAATTTQAETESHQQ